MLHRRNAQYSTTTMPLSRRQAPTSYSASSHRCKLLFAILVFIVLGVFIRERESRIRRVKERLSQHPEKGVQAVLVGADRLIGKGYRFISDQVSKRVSSTTSFGDFAARDDEIGQNSENNPIIQEEEDEENALFKQLLVEEGGTLQVEKNDHETTEKLMKMMEEGVVEDPHVDHEEQVDPSVEPLSHASVGETTIVMEGYHAAPSKEEIEAGRAIMVTDTAKDEFIEEQTDVEDEDEQAESEKSDISNSEAASLQTPELAMSLEDRNKLFLTGPFVKGPLVFKMVNSHFLAFIDAFKNAGWSRTYESASVSDVSLLITKPVTPVIGSSTKMISQISHSSCLGGTKGTQLSCRSKFALEHGCTFESLNISPKQYNMWKSADCERFFEMALRPENAEKQWIGKVGASYHGRHITIYTGVTKSIKSHYGKCKLNRDSGGGYIMMEYVSNPALLGNRKFDLRTFQLIASTNPFLVFYHRGFVRRSANKYSTDLSDKLAHVTNLEAQTSEDHFMGFDDLEVALHQELSFAPDYIRNIFEPRAKKITNYVFQAARSRLKRKLGAFQLFGLDWMIDRSGNMHLLEGNGNPVVKHYPGTNNLTPEIWRDMATLLTKIHMGVAQNVAQPFGPLKTGFRSGGWELVFSELEEIASAQPYNPCNAGL